MAARSVEAIVPNNEDYSASVIHTFVEVGIVTLPYSFIVIMPRSIIKRLYVETSAYFVLKGGNVAVFGFVFVTLA